MTQTEIIEREDEKIGEPMPSRPTKRDLAEGKLELVAQTKNAPSVSMTAGSMVFADAGQVADFATKIATAGLPLPPYLRGNPGAVFFLTCKAIAWRMDPTAVLEGSFEVNGRVGYMSQLIHAVIESRARLQHRLDCRYDGEYIGDTPEERRKKSTRSCTVIGMFDNGDVREYTSPPFRDIRIKNSPLWNDDPDQQLFYYASRSWARKWAPDVLYGTGMYTREELESMPPVEEPGPGLHARLVGSARTGEQEARQVQAESELRKIAPPAGAQQAQGAPVNAGGADAAEAELKRASEPPIGGTTVTKVKKRNKKPPPLPSSVAEYLVWAKDWINAETDPKEITLRWDHERKLRNDLGVTADDRVELDELRTIRRELLEQQS